jgi:5-formyltetrahydrofolate cyclo-ligase
MIRNRNDIRREMRARRRLVTRREREFAAQRFVVAAERAYLLRPGSRIAIYQPYGHEADVSTITARAWQRGCHVYAPVVTHRHRFIMQFVRFRPNACLAINAFGISEPENSPQDRIPPLQLDVIFMPLVAFDGRGWRLGSGAGFYDRCLRHLRGSRQWRRPKLIGVAYEHQKIDTLSPGDWDVPMDAVLTEARMYRFENHQSWSAQ